jgi:hypothetical protein
MEPQRTFDGIWYREKPAVESTRANPFVRERGRLVVEDDVIRFEGPKHSMVLRDVEAVEYGVYGTMTGPAVQVRYRDEGGEPRTAWFTDGGLGGFAGVFGGTRQLAQALSRGGPATFDDTGASVTQKRFALLIGGAVLFFVVRMLRELIERG